MNIDKRYGFIRAAVHHSWYAAMNIERYTTSAVLHNIQGRFTGGLQPPFKSLAPYGPKTQCQMVALCNACARH